MEYTKVDYRTLNVKCNNVELVIVKFIYWAFPSIMMWFLDKQLEKL